MMSFYFNIANKSWTTIYLAQYRPQSHKPLAREREGKVEEAGEVGDRSVPARLAEQSTDISDLSGIDMLYYHVNMILYLILSRFGKPLLARKLDDKIQSVGFWFWTRDMPKKSCRASFACR